MFFTRWTLLWTRWMAPRLYLRFVTTLHYIHGDVCSFPPESSHDTCKYDFLRLVMLLTFAASMTVANQSRTDAVSFAGP